MTSFYSWRLIFLVFNGKTRMDEEKYSKVHESSGVMTVPLMILALGALLFGFLFKNYFIGDYSESFWDHSIVVHHEEHHHIPFYIYYLPIVLGFLGLFIAWYMYIKNTKLASDIAKMNKPLYEFLLNKWYFDELYNHVFVQNIIKLSDNLWKKIDIGLIDRLGPNAIALSTKKVSKFFSSLQTGYIYHYVFSFIIGMTLLISFIIFFL